MSEVAPTDYGPLKPLVPARDRLPAHRLLPGPIDFGSDEAWFDEDDVTRLGVFFVRAGMQLEAVRDYYGVSTLRWVDLNGTEQQVNVGDVGVRVLIDGEVVCG